ncbi:MAG: hypothetical protein A2X94_00955 [Bdellovibrionales bacterium GWB1_55_8]|nr:MAG: hypothetical protein A2X94_00955 [Bdellovibrionales bacterium GWB1_55_8]
MDLSISNTALAVGAGMASVLSPCIFPVIPIIMAGGAGGQTKDRLRPLIVVLGLSITFMLMGAISSLFGTLLIGRGRYIEWAGSFLITLLGLMVILDLSVFKRFNLFSKVQVSGEGRFGGLLLGMSLGLIWVPCVGPFLSSILALVGTSGRVAHGITLLGFYSLGLAVPMLAIAYSSHLFRTKLRMLAQHERPVRYVTGGILVVYGIYSAVHGNMAF